MNLTDKQTLFTQLLDKEHRSIRAFYGDLCEIFSQFSSEDFIQLISQKRSEKHVIPGFNSHDFNLACYLFELHYMATHQGALITEFSPLKEPFKEGECQVTWFKGDCFQNLPPDISSERWGLTHSISYSKVKQAISGSI